MLNFSSSNRIVEKSELIEVKIPANLNAQPKSKIQLPDNQNLRNTFLLGIEAYTVEDIPLSIVTRSPVIGLALFRSIFLTLQGYNGKNFAWQQPLLDLHNIFDAQVGDPFNSFPYKYSGQKVNYPKSYIEIADTSLISTEVEQVVLLNIFYREFAKEEKKDKKASFKNRS